MRSPHASHLHPRNRKPDTPVESAKPEAFAWAPLGIPWRGKGVRPWEYRVTVCLPHLNTTSQLRLAIDLWRMQTVKPFFEVVDTGSAPSVMADLEALRSDDVEIHYIRAHGYTNSSGPVTAALDLAQTLCRTQFLFHTHTDVFPVRRDFLAVLLALCSPASPVVGWQMSERQNTEEWKDCVSHTATMLHMPTARGKALWWTMERYYDDKPAERVTPTQGWPDTESPFLHAMRAAGVTPVLLGTEPNYERHDIAANGVVYAEHARSFTGLKMQASGTLWARAQSYMADAEAGARGRLETWRKEKAAPVRRELPCLALGPVVERVSCNCPLKHSYTCLKGHGTVKPIDCYKTCGEYEPDHDS